MQSAMARTCMKRSKSGEIFDLVKGSPDVYAPRRRLLAKLELRIISAGCGGLWGCTKRQFVSMPNVVLVNIDWTRVGSAPSNYCTQHALQVLHLAAHGFTPTPVPVSYTHLRAHETPEHLVCRLLLEKKKKNNL
eukprot:TRINITY_DN3902_c0_g2_i2.p1 TRINITY_DN3902_c0_g2~~TRINITY_DN3902_c0_g2_i2.p1  ORF type:complete len:134 (+),score=4.92 TRINITY_DN3902_c0_g2_i2:102-503(+)